MYCNYYGFREKPFNITPDPGFIYLSAHHKEAFAHLLYGIDNHVGFIALTGEVGTGKTTVTRTLLGQLDRDKYRTALIFNPCLSSRGLMQAINREYGLPGDHADTAELLQELNQFLLSENAAGRTVVLVIDEAQNLEPGVLEQVRLISNLETERDKLIQIVLVGQPELRELLTRQDLRQLGQRIAVSYHLAPMDFADSQDYITHRLEVAGRRDAPLFCDGAVRRIFNFSGGLPRLINLACDRALLLGYTREKTPVSTAMATTAIADVRHTGNGRTPTRGRLLAGLGLLLFLLLSGALFGLTRQESAPAPPVAATPATTGLPVTARQELARMSEGVSLVQAFNMLAGSWHVAPFRETPGGSETVEELARARGLEVYRFSGSLGALARLATPALIELTVPGVPGRRFLALTFADGGRVTIAPPLSGRLPLTTAELESLWSGQGALLWKNYLEIPVALKPGMRGEKVSRLQGLLRGAGFYAGALNGRFDTGTHAAVKAFQAARGIEVTGLAGKQTLFFLYRSGGSPSPAFAGSGGHP